jgi:hypothetical protein
MLSNYERMYENMMRINATVSHLLSTVNVMQNHLDEKINWFSTLLHMAGLFFCVIILGTTISLVVMVKLLASPSAVGSNPAADIDLLSLATFSLTNYQTKMWQFLLLTVKQ